ncbi:MAG: DinB family protein [Thermoanaerobaculia bacterium]|nr:DinB family protein [Thermoanaerobaculia bacterium]
MKWTVRQALRLHQRASSELINVAGAIPDSAWELPREEGKWSPQTVVEHLNTTYDVILGELGGGSGMEVRTRPLIRFVLRLTMVPAILLTGKFPRNARAPRETRPPATESIEKTVMLDRFRERAGQLEQAALDAPSGTKITHAYFGSASVASGVTMCARHIQHHCAQLRAVLD